MPPKTTGLPGHDFSTMLGIAGARKASWPWGGEEGPEDILGDELPARGPLGKTTRDTQQAKEMDLPHFLPVDEDKKWK